MSNDLQQLWSCDVLNHITRLLLASTCTTTHSSPQSLLGSCSPYTTSINYLVYPPFFEPICNLFPRDGWPHIQSGSMDTKCLPDNFSMHSTITYGGSYNHTKNAPRSPDKGEWATGPRGDVWGWLCNYMVFLQTTCEGSNELKQRKLLIHRGKILQMYVLLRLL